MKITNGKQTFTFPDDCIYAEYDYSRGIYTGKFFTKEQSRSYIEDDELALGLESIDSMIHVDNFKGIAE